MREVSTGAVGLGVGSVITEEETRQYSGEEQSRHATETCRR